MLRLWIAFILLVSLTFTPVLALAESAFVEGHVFNKLTGVPLSWASVRILENITGPGRPLPVEVATGFTDSNGFYQFEVDEFLRSPIAIVVDCGTATGKIQGRSIAFLRAGLIRRDIYLEANRRLTLCHPIDPE